MRPGNICLRERLLARAGRRAPDLCELVHAVAVPLLLLLLTAAQVVAAA